MTVEPSKEALSDIGPTGYALTKEQYHERLSLGWCEYCKCYHRDMSHLDAFAQQARDKALEAAAAECDKWLARRNETLREIYGSDDLEQIISTLETAKAAGEKYAYKSLARAIRALKSTSGESE